MPRKAPQAVRTSAEELLAAVRPALEHLKACRKEAVANGHIVDVFLFGARRMELIGQRMLDGLEVARLRDEAAKAPAGEAPPLLKKADELVRKNRAAHEALGKDFAGLWLSESKPYGLEWTMKRYAAAAARGDGVTR